MICPKCKAMMFIDDYGGWKWTCIACDYVGRDATDDEIKQQAAYTSTPDLL